MTYRPCLWAAVALAAGGGCVPAEELSVRGAGLALPECLLPGDVNGDGEFNSTDMLLIYQAAKYGTRNPAHWFEGDFDGDDLANESDLTIAFQTGAYEAGPRCARAPALLVVFDRTMLSPLQDPLTDPDVADVFDDHALVEAQRLLPVTSLSQLAGLYRLRVAPQEIRSVAEALTNLSIVRGVEEELAYRISTNDPEYPQQWHLQNAGDGGGTAGADIDYGRRLIGLQGHDAVIAIIDTGVNTGHPDLAANIWTNPGETGGGREHNGIDDDGNGYVDDHRGYDFVSISGADLSAGEDPGPPDNDPADVQGHGTHMAGIAAAVTDNGVGVAGVAPLAKIMALRAGFRTPQGDGSFRTGDLVAAIHYAINQGADVINLSLGGGFSPNLAAAVDAALRAHVIVVAAAGNEGSSEPAFPAALNGVVAVAATDRNDRLAEFSNFGDWVDIAAPGVGILSTAVDGGYVRMSGTSMACAIVAGIAAVTRSKHVPTGVARFTDAIRQNADSLAESGRPFGRADIVAVLQGVLTETAATTGSAPPSAELQFTVSDGRIVKRSLWAGRVYEQSWTTRRGPLRVEFTGRSSEDSATIAGDPGGIEIVHSVPGRTEMMGDNYVIILMDFERVVIDAGSVGGDRAYLTTPSAAGESRWDADTLTAHVEGGGSSAPVHWVETRLFQENVLLAPEADHNDLRSRGSALDDDVYLLQNEVLHLGRVQATSGDDVIVLPTLLAALTFDAVTVEDRHDGDVDRLVEIARSQDRRYALHSEGAWQTISPQ